MLYEGGHEATSCWEYGLPANFAEGIEEVIAAAPRSVQGVLDTLQAIGSTEEMDYDN
jgi:hypothetical protein